MTRTHATRLGQAVRRAAVGRVNDRTVDAHCPVNAGQLQQLEVTFRRRDRTEIQATSPQPGSEAEEDAQRLRLEDLHRIEVDHDAVAARFDGTETAAQHGERSEIEVAAERDDDPTRR